MDAARQLNLAAELGIGPVAYRERQATRSATDMKAALRPRGSMVVPIRILDLSTKGFCAAAQLHLAPGTDIWLRLPGLETWPSKVAWIDGGRLGGEFDRPLHPAVLTNVLRKALSRTA